MSDSDSVNGVISRYLIEKQKASKQTDINIEFEIRFDKITKAVFNELFTKINKDKEYVNKFTINIINRIDKKSDSYIKELVFNDKYEKVKINHYIKSKIIPNSFNVDDGVKFPYHISLNMEAKCKETMAVNLSTMRFKNRREFTIDIGGSIWALDFTVVKTMLAAEIKSSEVLQQIKTEFFSSWDYPNSIYEIEIEHKSGPITADSIRKVVELISGTSSVNVHNQAEIYKIAQILIVQPHYLYKYKHTYGLKKLLPQAVTLSKQDWFKLYPPTGMYATIKADGTRSIMHFYNNKIHIINESCKIIDFIQKPNMPNVIVLDGEYIDDKFMAFDIIKIGTKIVTGDPFTMRLAHMQTLLPYFKDTIIEFKEYILLGDGIGELKSQLNNLWNSTKLKKDGIIFTTPGKSYEDTINYKWKPADKCSIDFLVKRYKDEYLLFVSITEEQFDKLGLSFCSEYSHLFPQIDKNIFPIQFSPACNPDIYHWSYDDPSLDNKICELTYIDGNWKLDRIREDRTNDLMSGEYFGNSFYVAELTLLNIIDPFPLEMLYTGVSNDYFAKAVNDIHKSQIATVSALKTWLFSNIDNGAKWVMDIGIGKGQDIHRYTKLEIQNLIAVDRDRAALSELVRRRYNINTTKGFPIRIEIADINETPYEELIKRISKYTDNITYSICNLACHYFMATEDLANNFINLVTENSKYVILSMFSGAKVHDLFMSNGIKDGESWEYEQKNIRKYQLTRKYSDDKLQNYGQKIGVLLPFNNDEQYDEYLVNIDWLIAQFAKRGFKLMERKAASEFIDSVSNNDKLTKEDKTYIDLYEGLIFISDS